LPEQLDPLVGIELLAFEAVELDGRLAPEALVRPHEVVVGDEERGERAGNTKIQDNFIVNLTESPWQWPDSTHSTDSAGDANLASWLQSQYTGTTPNAAYAILRLNPDAVPVGTYRGVRIKSSDAAYGDSPEPGEIRPTLTVETIPEPATIGLLGLAGLGAMIARRLRLG